MAQGGNEAAQLKLRARWDPRDFSMPDSGDTSRIRDFIRMTYKEKKWVAKSSDLGRSTQGTGTISQSGSFNIAPPPSQFGTIRPPPAAEVSL